MSKPFKNFSMNVNELQIFEIETALWSSSVKQLERGLPLTTSCGLAFANYKGIWIQKKASAALRIEQNIFFRVATYIAFKQTYSSSDMHTLSSSEICILYIHRASLLLTLGGVRMYMKQLSKVVFGRISKTGFLYCPRMQLLLRRN